MVNKLIKLKTLGMLTQYKQICNAVRISTQLQCNGRVNNLLHTQVRMHEKGPLTRNTPIL